MTIREHATDNGIGLIAEFHPAAPDRRGATPLSAQVQDAARTLAGKIERGAFNELLPHARTDLRALSLTMACWADRVETMEVELLLARLQATRLVVPLRARLGRVLMKLLRV